MTPPNSGVRPVSEPAACDDIRSHPRPVAAVRRDSAWHTVDEWAHEVGALGVIETAVLLVSEVATNVVKHAGYRVHGVRLIGCRRSCVSRCPTRRRYRNGWRGPRDKSEVGVSRCWRSFLAPGALTNGTVAPRSSGSKSSSPSRLRTEPNLAINDTQGAAVGGASSVDHDRDGTKLRRLEERGTNSDQAICRYVIGGGVWAMVRLRSVWRTFRR